MLWQRNEKKRMQLRVNGLTLTKKDYHDWLEQHDGTKMLALMTKYYLLKEAATKANVAPTEAEIQKGLDDYLELNPAQLETYKSQPWLKVDVKRDIEMSMCAVNLTTKDIGATDDELKSFYDDSPGRYDTPEKFHTKILKGGDSTTTEQVKTMLTQIFKPDPNKPGQFRAPEMQSLQQQFPKLNVMFGDGTFVVRRPLQGGSGDPILDQIARMKPGEVLVIPTPNSTTSLIVAMEYIEPGKKADFNDPEVKKKVARDFKVSRAQPEKELLRTLYDLSTIETDPPDAKNVVEYFLFPERYQLKALQPGG